MSFRTRDTLNPWQKILLGILVLPLLYAVHRFNHILSHDIAEIFSVIVACGIFMFSWNARPFLENGYYLFIGIAFLFVGALDFIHAMSYEGMFSRDELNLPSQLWYAARYLQSFSLLAAPLFCDRKMDGTRVAAVYTAVTGFLLGSIFLWRIFPDCYVAGVGVTGFKTFSDYFVSFLLFASLGTLHAKRDRFDPEVKRLLQSAVLLAVGSELSFHLYRDYYAYNNLVGHYLKIVSFYLFYKAFVETGLFRPYALLFRNLKRSEEELRAGRDRLESRVAERTAELRAANLLLEEELDRQQRALEMREMILDLLELTQSVRTVRELLSSLTAFVKERFGCDAVGVRYRSNGDYPYFVTRGFSREFVEAEMHLCAAERVPCGADAGGEKPFYECLCGAVISGRVDRSLPFFTPGGTFWTNSASEMLAESGAIHTIATRGRCARDGYESVALVPLRIGEDAIGLLQVNDRRKGQFPPRRLVKLERIAENVAAVLGRLLAQEALAESEARFRSLVEKSSFGILIARQGRIAFANPRQEEFFPEIREGSLLREIGTVHPDDAAAFDRLCAAADGNGLPPGKMILRFHPPGGDSAGGGVRWLQCQCQEVAFRGGTSLLIEMVDISRVRDLEQIVSIRDKLSLLGQMAAGIAHEIRNPLSGVNLNLSTLSFLCRESESMEDREKEQVRVAVEQAQAASDKIGSVVRGIMEFSRPIPPSLRGIDVNGVIGKAIEVSLPAARTGGVEISAALAPDLPRRRGDPRLLEQVLVNLIANAVQAMGNSDGDRRIDVSSSVEDGSIVLRVADTGPGVPAPLRDRIFDPFFTTRKGGHGIGLAFSHRVVSEHGGKMSVGAGRLGGAEFRIDLPLENGRTPE